MQESSEKKCHLVINEKEKAQVELMFEKFLELKTLSRTLNFLNQEGYKTKKYITKSNRRVGGYRWTQTGLYSSLTNLSYIGKREINKSKRHLEQEKLPKEERYKVVKAHWPPLVSEEVFYAVQEQLEANKKRSFRNIHIYRISGLLYCGLCGEPLSGQSSTGREGVRYFYYGHKRKMMSYGNRHSKRCELERIPAIKIEEAVLSRLGRLSQDRKLLSQVMSESRPDPKAQKEHLKNLITYKEQERKRIEQEREGLLSALSGAKSEESREVILEKVEELTQSYKILEESIEELRSEKAKKSDNVINLEEYFTLLNQFQSNCAILPLEEQKNLIKDFIKRIVVTKEGLILEYYARAQKREPHENKELFKNEPIPLKGGSGTDTVAYEFCVGRGTRT